MNEIYLGMRKYLVFVGSLLLCTQVIGQIDSSLYPSKMVREQLIKHKGYSLSYNSSYVLPSWVAYKVTDTVPIAGKTKVKYMADPMINTRSASTKDYKNSGFIYGQLVNKIDVGHIVGADVETYYMSNIVPMKTTFNTYIWLKIEELVRLWSKNTDELIVFCGPIIKDGPFPTLGENKLSIPERFYKVVYDRKNQKAIGFICKNYMSSNKLKSYSKTIDEVEKETGIDFFIHLDEKVQSTLESVVDYELWNFDIE